ncbi:MAG: hypothetical protein AAF639_12240 [Chloroflexota bacterium]
MRRKLLPTMVRIHEASAIPNWRLSLVHHPHGGFAEMLIGIKI